MAVLQTALSVEDVPNTNMTKSLKVLVSSNDYLDSGIKVLEEQ